MASSDTFEVAVGPAVGGFADADSDNLPDPSGAGVTFTGWNVIKGSFLDGMVQKFNAAEHARFGPGSSSVSPEGVKNNTGGALYGAAAGEFFDAYDGVLAFTHRLRNTAGASHALQAFHQSLVSSFAANIPGAANDTVAAGGPYTTTTFDVDTPGQFTEGEVICRTANNVTEFAVVTDITGAQLTINPAFSSAPAAASTIRMCVTYYPVIGTSPTDVHVTFEMGDTGASASIRRIAAGCRLQTLGLSLDGETWIASQTLLPARVFEDDSNANVAATSEPPGSALQQYGAETLIGDDHVGGSSPFKSARTDLDLFNWSAEITFALAPSSPNGRSLLRMGDMQINGAECKVTIAPEYNATIKDLLRLEEKRTMVFGMGPTGTGEGGCLILNSAGRADGKATPTAGDNARVEMPTVLQAETFSGVTATTDLATAPFVLALCLG